MNPAIEKLILELIITAIDLFARVSKMLKRRQNYVDTVLRR